MIALLAGCSGPPAEAGSSALEVAVAWSEHAESVPILSFRAEPGARSWVEFGLDGAFDRRTPEVEDEEVAMPLLGLAAGRSYTWRVVSGEQLAEGQLTVPDAPEEIPRLVVEAEPGAEVSEGYVLSAVSTSASDPQGTTWIVVWNGLGEPVWWRALETGHITVSPTWGATPGTLWWDDYDLADGLRSKAVRAHLDGSAVLEVPTAVGHHVALEPEPDVITWAARDVRESAAPGVWITADRVYEAPITSADAPREVVNLYDDHFGGTYEPPCEHPLVPWTWDGLSPVYEWSHLNSIAWLPERDAYLLHLRWTDTTLLVDRPTGGILATLGGPFGVAQELMSHAHFSHAWDGGLVAFDNGSHREPRVSGVVELAWDEGTGELTEVFRWDDPQGRFVGILGDARKLPGGSYLSSWSTLGELVEVTSDGRQVWHATTEPLLSVARVQFARDLYEVAP